jgi:hypothetical protein
MICSNEAIDNVSPPVPSDDDDDDDNSVPPTPPSTETLFDFEFGLRDASNEEVQATYDAGWKRATREEMNDNPNLQ